jgi:hypothetical protein
MAFKNKAGDEKLNPEFNPASIVPPKIVSFVTNIRQ